MGRGSWIGFIYRGHSLLLKTIGMKKKDIRFRMSFSRD
jgi:hypothetical protein